MRYTHLRHPIIYPITADADEGETPINESMLSPEDTEEQATPGLQNNSPFATDSRQVDRNRSDGEDERERRMSTSRRRYLEEAEEATTEANRRADPGVVSNSASEEAALRAKAMSARRRREAAEEELRSNIDQINRLNSNPNDEPSDNRSGRNLDTRGDGRRDRNYEHDGAGVESDNIRRQGAMPQGEPRGNSGSARQIYIIHTRTHTCTPVLTHVRVTVAKYTRRTSVHTHVRSYTYTYAYVPCTIAM